MFFAISKIFVFLIFPLSLACLLLIAAWWAWMKHPRLGRGLIIVALALLWLPSTSPVADLFLLPLETHYPIVGDSPHAEAVVVLTGMVHMKAVRGDRIEMGEAVDRILTGVELVRQDRVDYLVISGGSGDLFDQSLSEALFLNRFAIQLGIPAERILLEETSRNTHESAVQTGALLQEAGISDIILVTSAFHMPRSMGCFQKVGFDPLPYPVDYRTGLRDYNPLSLLPQVGNLQRSSTAIREYVGLIMYRLRGYI